MDDKSQIAILKKIGFRLIAALLPLLLTANAAYALGGPPIGPNLSQLGSCNGTPGIGQAICNVILSATWVPGLISAIGYLGGAIFVFTGVLKTKEHVLTPDRVTIWEPVKRFITAGALFALPTVLDALYSAIAGSGLLGNLLPSGYTGFNGQTSGGGLDTVIVALVKDIWAPLHNLMSGFAYLAGLVLALIGIFRLVKSSQEGTRGPGGFGTIMTFGTAAALFTLDRLMGAFSFSTFGNVTTATAPFMMYTDGMTAEEVNHVHAVISAVIAFIALVGWMSFIRGIFIIRDVAEGKQQASLMAGITHIFGGALAVNLGPLLNAVQVTLGLLGVGVLFA